MWCSPSLRRVSAVSEIVEPVVAGRRPHSEVAAILVLREWERVREPDDWDLCAGQIAARAGLPARVVCRALARMAECGEVVETAVQGWQTWYQERGYVLPRADRRYRLVASHT